MGTSILTKLQAKEPIIIDISAIIIAAMEVGRDFKNQSFNKIKQRIKDNVNMLGTIVYKHVLRAHNQNTAFFHNNLKLRRVGNQIDKIQVEGQEIKGREEIKEAAHKYYKNLLIAREQ